MGPPLGDATQGHKTVRFDLSVSCGRPPVFDSRKLNYRKGDYARLSAVISRVDWHALLAKLSIDDAYAEFLAVYESACRECIPLKKPQTAAKLPWFTRDRVAGQEEAQPVAR